MFEHIVVDVYVDALAHGRPSPEARRRSRGGGERYRVHGEGGHRGARARDGLARDDDELGLEHGGALALRARRAPCRRGLNAAGRRSP